MATNRILTRTLYTIVLAMLVATPLAAIDDPNAPSAKERELLAVLRSDAPKSEKAITCKLLAIHGSGAAATDLAQLLPDPELASWARIALEAIPDEAVDEALRSATDSLDGILLVGAINSIGVRRDADAVGLLTDLLQAPDAEVASAAAVALGHIGGPAAAQTLQQSLTSAPADVRSAVAEGCVLCAEHLFAEGDAAAAVEIYDEVRKVDVPKPRLIEATRGAILARGQAGIPLLLEQFRSPDTAFFQLALSTAREFPGRDVDPALAQELERATSERAALIVEAMADRADTVELAAVLNAAKQGPKPVRLAAIAALGRIGDASCLPALLESGVDADADLADAAKATLADLPGEDVDAQIVALLPTAKGNMYPLLLELVGRRRIDASAALMKALDHTDGDVRQAALAALGETISLDQLPVLISQVTSPRQAVDLAAAQQALKAASVRMPDREACAELLAAAVDRTASASTKCSLLETLGAVGGTKALETLGEAAKSSHDDLQDVSTRLLGEWMTADAAPVLLNLAKTAPGEKYQVRALRGYIRIARQFVLSEEERVQMCRKAMDTAWQTAEKRLVLDVLKRYPNSETLQLAIDAAQSPELKEEATQTALVIAQKLGGRQVNAEELLAKIGVDPVDLEIVKAEYGAEPTQKDVTDILRQQAGNLPLITLPSSSYNTSFGGDPAPGRRKRLTIQYRMNGKVGEASFRENDLIVLPMPK